MFNFIRCQFSPQMMLPLASTQEDTFVTFKGFTLAMLLDSMNKDELKIKDTKTEEPITPAQIASTSARVVGIHTLHAANQERASQHAKRLQKLADEVRKLHEEAIRQLEQENSKILEKAREFFKENRGQIKLRDLINPDGSLKPEAYYWYFKKSKVDESSRKIFASLKEFEAEIQKVAKELRQNKKQLIAELRKKFAIPEGVDVLEFIEQNKQAQKFLETQNLKQMWKYAKSLKEKSQGLRVQIKNEFEKFLREFRFREEQKNTMMRLFNAWTEGKKSFDAFKKNLITYFSDFEKEMRGHISGIEAAHRELSYNHGIIMTAGIEVEKLRLPNLEELKSKIKKFLSDESFIKKSGGTLRTTINEASSNMGRLLEKKGITLEREILIEICDTPGVLTTERVNTTKLRKILEKHRVGDSERIINALRECFKEDVCLQNQIREIAKLRKKVGAAISQVKAIEDKLKKIFKNVESVTAGKTATKSFENCIKVLESYQKLIESNEAKIISKVMSGEITAKDIQQLIKSGIINDSSKKFFRDIASFLKKMHKQERMFKNYLKNLMKVIEKVGDVEGAKALKQELARILGCKVENIAKGIENLEAKAILEKWSEWQKFIESAKNNKIFKEAVTKRLERMRIELNGLRNSRGLLQRQIDTLRGRLKGLEKITQQELKKSFSKLALESPEEALKIIDQWEKRGVISATNAKSLKEAVSAIRARRIELQESLKRVLKRTGAKSSQSLEALIYAKILQETELVGNEAKLLETGLAKVTANTEKALVLKSWKSGLKKFASTISKALKRSTLGVYNAAWDALFLPISVAWGVVKGTWKGVRNLSAAAFARTFFANIRNSTATLLSNFSPKVAEKVAVKEAAKRLSKRTIRRIAKTAAKKMAERTGQKISKDVMKKVMTYVEKQAVTSTKEAAELAVGGLLQHGAGEGLSKSAIQEVTQVAARSQSVLSKCLKFAGVATSYLMIFAAGMEIINLLLASKIKGELLKYGSPYPSIAPPYSIYAVEDCLEDLVQYYKIKVSKDEKPTENHIEKLLKNRVPPNNERAYASAAGSALTDVLGDVIKKATLVEKTNINAYINGALEVDVLIAPHTSKGDLPTIKIKLKEFVGNKKSAFEKAIKTANKDLGEFLLQCKTYYIPISKGAEEVTAIKLKDYIEQIKNNKEIPDYVKDILEANVKALERDDSTIKTIREKYAYLKNQPKRFLRNIGKGILRIFNVDGEPRIALMFNIKTQPNTKYNINAWKTAKKYARETTAESLGWFTRVLDKVVVGFLDTVSDIYEGLADLINGVISDWDAVAGCRVVLVRIGEPNDYLVWSQEKAEEVRNYGFNPVYPNEMLRNMEVVFEKEFSATECNPTNKYLTIARNGAIASGLKTIILPKDIQLKPGKYILIFFTNYILDLYTSAGKNLAYWLLSASLSENEFTEEQINDVIFNSSYGFYHFILPFAAVGYKRIAEFRELYNENPQVKNAINMGEILTNENISPEVKKTCLSDEKECQKVLKNQFHNIVNASERTMAQISSMEKKIHDEWAYDSELLSDIIKLIRIYGIPTFTSFVLYPEDIKLIYGIVPSPRPPTETKYGAIVQLGTSTIEFAQKACGGVERYIKSWSIKLDNKEVVKGPAIEIFQAKIEDSTLYFTHIPNLEENKTYSIEATCKGQKYYGKLDTTNAVAAGILVSPIEFEDIKLKLKSLAKSAQEQKTS